MKLITFLLLLTTTLFAEFTSADYNEVKKLIAMVESRGTGDLKAENKRGFLGRYQFGAAALVDCKLVKGDRYTRATYISSVGNKNKVVWRNGLTHKKFLANKSNWLISGGKKDFFSNEKLQEACMDYLLKANYKFFKKHNINMKDKKAVKGLLMAAHLGGSKNALAYAKNKTEYKDAFGTKISKYYKIGSSNTPKNIEVLAKKYLGGKYTWGGTTPKKGMDCSGYTKFIFNKVGVKLPRTAWQQSKIGKDVKGSLKKGDLLFFNTDPKRGIPVTHVGVYLEDGKFIHAASTKKGIIISPLAGFYKKTYLGAKRVLNDVKASSKGFVKLKTAEPLVFPKDFFKPTLKNALIAKTKIAMTYDPLVVYQGRYMRQSQVNKIKDN